MLNRMLLNRGEKSRVLSSTSLFESLSPEEIEMLDRRTPEVHLDRDQIWYTPGYLGRILFVVLRGRVRVYKAAGGREITLAVVRAGEIFGEAVLAAGRRPMGAYAQAMVASEVALVNLEMLGRLVRDRPEIGLKAMEILSERICFYQDRMADMIHKEVPARLARLVLRLVESEGIVTREGYKIPTHSTHQQLGEMIGATRVATTRALGKLRRAGAVELRERRIYVNDIEALKKHVAGE